MEQTNTVNKYYSPHIALIVAQIMFGSAPVLGKFALQAFPIYTIISFRVVIAALAFYFLQHKLGDFWLKERKDYFYFAALSCLGVVFNQLFFFNGLLLTTASNTSLLAVTIPIFALLISMVAGNDNFSWRKLAGVFFSVSGVIYLIEPCVFNWTIDCRASFFSGTTQGDILIILNCLCYAAYVGVSKKLISKYGAIKSLAWLFLFGCFFTAPLGLISLKSVHFSQIGILYWFALVAIILFPTVLSYYWNAWALTRVEPSIVAVYIYLQPLVGFLLAVFFLGEQFSARFVVSALLIFGGVFLVTRKTAF